MNHVKEPRYKVGDHVRVLHFDPKRKEVQDYYRKKYPPVINPESGRTKRHNPIKTKHEAPFSDEIFTIDKVLMGDPIVYKLYSPDAGIKILGKFYESELSLVGT